MNTVDFNLKKFFSPASIAIIGASQDFDSIGGKPVRNLLNHGYQGKLHLVNPKYKEIHGLKCYASVLDIPEEVDVALIATSHKIMKPIMQECGEKGVKHAILFGAGFAELGSEGEKLQQEILEIARNSDIRLVGPNCVGSLNVIDSIPMGFATSFETDSFISGNVALASQSGAFGYSVFGLAQEERIGFSYVANTGNQVDLTTLDFLEEMVSDPHSTVLAAYLESIPNGEQFIDVLKQAKKVKKPVIVLKSGRSKLGQQAALSHTASIAGSSEVYDAVARQYGAVTVYDMNEMIDAMKIFSRGKRAKGSNVGVVTTSGASGIMMADMSEENQLNLAELTDTTRSAIEEIIPSFGSALNPIDITLQALNEKHILSDTIKVLVEAKECDVIVIATTLGGELGERVCQDIVELDKETDKPIVVNLTGRLDIVGGGLRILQEAGIPVYQTPSQTIQSIAKLVAHSHFIRKQEGTLPKNVDHISLSNKENVWTEEKVKPILEKLNIKVPKGIVVKDEDDLEKIGTTLQFPTVMKIISPDILHKSDANAVKVGVHKEKVKETFQQIMNNAKAYHPNAALEGVLIEEMLEMENATEMFIGVTHDPVFGAMVACGFGGIFIEILKDVSLRQAPFDTATALEMLKELKGYDILTGARGRAKADINAFAEALSNISVFAAEQNGKLKELDLNPIVILENGKGIVALDGIIIW